MPKMRSKADLPTKICAVCKAAIRLAAEMGAGLARREISVPNGVAVTGDELLARKADHVRKDMKTGLAPSVDPDEIARFEALAEDWWNPDGA